MPEQSLNGENAVDFTNSSTGTTEKGKIAKPPRSPDSGTVLTKSGDGSYYDNSTGLNYSMDNSGKIIGPPRSPDSGTVLTKTDSGFYHDEYGGSNYIVIDKDKERRIIALRDPMSGGELIPNKKGTFSSKSTGGEFALYNDKNFVPLYVPDGTSEPAHIEDGKLVANKTGRSFEIDEKGRVLTPQEIEYQRAVQEDTKRLSDRIDALEKKMNELIIANFEQHGRFSEEIIREFSLGNLTVEQRDQRINELNEKFDKQLKNIQNWFLYGLTSNTGEDNKPEPNSEPEQEQESQPELEPESELGVDKNIV